MRRPLAGLALALAALLALGRLLSQDPREEARRRAQAAEPGGTLESELWQALVLVGVGDETPGNWDGQFRVSGGEIHRVDGYRFVPPDRVLPEGQWRIATQTVMFMPESSLAYEGVKSQRPVLAPKGILMRGAGTAATRVTLVVRGASCVFQPMGMAVGDIQRFLEGRVEVRRIPPVTDLSGTELRQHDFPAGSSGTRGGGPFAYERCR